MGHGQPEIPVLVIPAFGRDDVLGKFSRAEGLARGRQGRLASVEQFGSFQGLGAAVVAESGCVIGSGGIEELDRCRKVQQVAPGVREPGVQAVDMLLDVGLLGPEHGENEGLGHASEMGLDRLGRLWRLRHNTAGPTPSEARWGGERRGGRPATSRHAPAGRRRDPTPRWQGDGRP